VRFGPARHLAQHAPVVAEQERIELTEHRQVGDGHSIRPSARRCVAALGGEARELSLDLQPADVPRELERAAELLLTPAQPRQIQLPERATKGVEQLGALPRR
jgi:hypothetical protein